VPERAAAVPDEDRAGYPSLPYSMLVWPLPPYYLPPAPLPPPPDPVRSALPAAGAYVIDPARSTVIFTARALGVVPVRGRLGAVSGRAVVGVRAEDSTVTVDVSASGLTTGNTRRDRDLLGSRFLDASAHPVLRFTAARFGTRLGAWIAPGLLQVRGITEPVAFLLDPARREGDGAVVVRARGEVDRRRFGICAPRFRVGSRIRIDVEITAVPEEPAGK
jgi:polyisoprenoid-binding protein YceI